LYIFLTRFIIYKGLKYIFYRIYKWQLIWFGKTSVPQESANFGISSLIYINILTVIITLEVILNLQMIDSLEYPKLSVAMFILVLASINSTIFIRKGKYLKIAEEFKNESNELRKKRTIFMWTYILSTFIIFFIVIAIK